MNPSMPSRTTEPHLGVVMTGTPHAMASTWSLAIPWQGRQDEHVRPAKLVHDPAPRHLTHISGILEVGPGDHAGVVWPNDAHVGPDPAPLQSTSSFGQVMGAFGQAYFANKPKRVPE